MALTLGLVLSLAEGAGQHLLSCSGDDGTEGSLGPLLSARNQAWVPGEYAMCFFCVYDEADCVANIERQSEIPVYDSFVVFRVFEISLHLFIFSVTLSHSLLSMQTYTPPSLRYKSGSLCRSPEQLRLT